MTTESLWRVFGRIGFLSFGGPAAQIALMHRELVDRRGWLTEAEYLRALSFCMLLPGPEAMQLATYAGWRVGGIRGGLIAGGLFVLPGAALILALAAAYAAYGSLPWVAPVFLGIKAAVVAIVIEALIKVARRSLKGGTALAIAALSFAALFLGGLPFPAVIVAAALAGAVLFAGAPTEATALPPNRHFLPVVAAGLALWFAPLLALALAGAPFLVTLGLYFSKLSVVTFGGAYSVLAYMAQSVVNDYGWITTPAMMDALGLAETTPGPLILVTEFVAYLSGHGQGGAGMGVAAAALALWVTFLPCFLWIFAFAPYVEWLAHQPRLSGALKGIMAAVVGVIASLSLWFALHLFFGPSLPRQIVGLEVMLPDPTGFDPRATLLAALSAWLLIGRKWPMLIVLALSGAGGAVLSLAAG